MIDKNYRLFGLVSIIDIAIVALLAVFVLIALRFSSPRELVARPGDETIRFTVELQRRMPSFKESIRVDVPIEDSIQGLSLGTIVDFYVEPFLDDVPDHYNEIIRRVPVEGLETLYIVIEAMAQVTDYATLIGGTYEILIGREVFIKNSDFASAGIVVRIEREDEL